MSANLTLITNGLAAFSSNDFDAAVRDMHPDIEWHVVFLMPDLPPGKTVFHGVDEVKDLWALTKSGWADLQAAVEDVIADQGDTTVVRTRFVGKLRESDVTIDRVVYYVFEIQDGLLRRLRPFDTEAEALAAAE